MSVIAFAIGRRSGETGCETRSSPIVRDEAEAHANTHRTFTKSIVRNDGSTRIVIERKSNGGERVELVSIFLNPEHEPATRLSVQFGAGVEPRDFQIRNGQRLEIRTLPKLDPASNGAEKGSSAREGIAGIGP